MNAREQYNPGPATGAHIDKSLDKWTLVLTRDLRHSPEKIWKALTDPVHLREWAPFDAESTLAASGTTVKLTTAGMPGVPPSEAKITRADSPRLLEYTWAGQDLRWELQPTSGGTRLTLWHNIDRRFIAWGAAGWHICIDVLDHHLLGSPIGRMVGADTMKFSGWQRLVKEYASQFNIENPV